MKHIIGMDGKKKQITWEDVSHAVHHDLKGHIGHGLVHQKSGKQKLNTKSSTESEIVGASDCLPWNIYKVKKNIFMQDNESVIKIEINLVVSL